MGKATFFGGGPSPVNQQFDFERDYPFLEELLDEKAQVVGYS